MSNLILAASDRVAFQIGSLTVEWYGIIITAAMVLGLIYIMFEGKRVGLSKDDGLELFLWIIPFAVIFARIVYVLAHPSNYFGDGWDGFVHLIAIWEGGITIVGGILGGIIGAILFCKIRKKNFLKVVDLVVPPLLLGQSIGRWGNFINQEAFGVAITDPKLQKFPIAVYIDHYGSNYSPGWHAATFFYESMWNLLGFILCYIIWRKNKKAPGILLFFYFAWYFLIRGILETIRLDAVVSSSGVGVTMVVSFVLVGLTIPAGILYYRIIKKQNEKLIAFGEYARTAGLAGDISVRTWEDENALPVPFAEDANADLKNNKGGKGNKSGGSGKSGFGKSTKKKVPKDDGKDVKINDDLKMK